MTLDFVGAEFIPRDSCSVWGAGITVPGSASKRTRLSPLLQFQGCRGECDEACRAVVRPDQITSPASYITPSYVLEAAAFARSASHSGSRCPGSNLTATS